PEPSTVAPEPPNAAATFGCVANSLATKRPDGSPVAIANALLLPLPLSVAGVPPILTPARLVTVLPTWEPAIAPMLVKILPSVCALAPAKPEPPLAVAVAVAC